MKKTPRTCIVAALFAAFVGLAAPAVAQHASHDAAPASTSKFSQTDAALRDLWVGHVFWVRNVVASTLDGNAAAAKAAENEVVANARAIAAAIEPFYGKAAADKLFGLLAGHYGAVKQYLEATTAGNTAKQDAASQALIANAGEIATFLSGANPHLPFDAVNGLLLAHGGHHLQEIQQFKDRQYAAEAQTWAAMTKHMYVIADALTGALAQQFPARFN